MLGEFDFFSDEFQHNPGATFTHMIKVSPVHKPAEHGWYSVFRYADIARILRDNETFSARFGPGPGYAPQDGAPVLVRADPPPPWQTVAGDCHGFPCHDHRSDGGADTEFRERVSGRTTDTSGMQGICGRILAPYSRIRGRR